MSAPPGLVWYRQAKLSDGQVVGVPAGNTVNVQVYVRVINGADLAGLEFRAIVTSNGAAPALNQTVQFIAAAGITNPISQLFLTDEFADPAAQNFYRAVLTNSIGPPP